LHLVLFVVLMYFIHYAKIHVSEPSVFKCGPVRTQNGVSWVAGRSIRTSFLLLSCSANYQQSASAAELFNELSAERFICWVIQRIISVARQLLSSANYQQTASAAELYSELSEKRFSCRVVQRIISTYLQQLSFTANCQQSASAAEFNELSALRFSCWVVQRTSENNASAAGLYSELSADFVSSWVLQRIVSRALQLLSCTANCQNNASGAGLYNV
jgi:hypothetical protein